MIYQLLASDASGVRRRCLELLQRPEAVADYRELIGSSERGEIDRQILAHCLRRMLAPSQQSVDQTIDFAIGLIDAYEQVGGHLETVMQGLLWGLTHCGGRATQAKLLAHPVLASHLDQAGHRLRQACARLERELARLAQHPHVLQTVDERRLQQLLSDAQAGLSGDQGLVDQVLARHERVQQQKGKGVWIERDPP